MQYHSDYIWKPEILYILVPGLYNPCLQAQIVALLCTRVQTSILVASYCLKVFDHLSNTLSGIAELNSLMCFLCKLVYVSMVSYIYFLRKGSNT